MKLAKIKIVLSIILLSTGLLIFFYIKNRVPFAEQKPAVNDAAPAISLADLSGKMVSLSYFQGHETLHGACPERDFSVASLLQNDKSEGFRVTVYKQRSV